MSSYCLSPYQSRGNISLPCGKCANCRKKQSSEWAFRMKKEIDYFPDKNVYTFFLTLTYSDENLPVNEDGKVTLRHSDYTKFIKMLRQQLYRDFGKVVKLSIIGCGEYGDESGRPHYHCIIHGIPFGWKKNSADIVSYFEEKWHYGFVYAKPCNGDVAGYVTKYSVKSLNKSRRYYQELGVEPPFRVYSQKIGYNYFEKNQDRIRREGFCRDGEFKVSIPRYFKDRFFLFGDYVKGRKVIFDRSVELLKKKSVISDDFSLDTERLAYLSKYSDKIRRVISRLEKNQLTWCVATCANSLYYQYIRPILNQFQVQITTLKRMLFRAFDAIQKVRGYDIFNSVLFKLREIERSLANQARDDLISMNFFRKRLC